jgi:hypothetical protein
MFKKLRKWLREKRCEHIWIFGFMRHGGTVKDKICVRCDRIEELDETYRD